jgi:hypothetical protein
MLKAVLCSVKLHKWLILSPSNVTLNFLKALTRISLERGLDEEHESIFRLNKFWNLTKLQRAQSAYSLRSKLPPTNFFVSFMRLVTTPDGSSVSWFPLIRWNGVEMLIQLSSTARSFNVQSAERMLRKVTFTCSLSLAFKDEENPWQFAAVALKYAYLMLHTGRSFA